MPDRNARVWTGSAWESISAPVSAANAVAVWQSTAPSSPTTGQIWIDSDDNKMYVWSGSAWIAVALDLSLYATKDSPIFTGTVVLPTNTSIGNVSSTELGYLDGTTSSIQTQLDAKASLSSPAFSGTPTAPTAAVLTNTTQIATTAFVNAEISNDAVLKTGGSTITVDSGTTVPLTIQNNGTGNSFVVNDVASDTTPFVIDASGNVSIGGITTANSVLVQGNLVANNNIQTRPGSGSGVAINWNYTGGAAETDIWNLYLNAQTAFSFKQLTGTGTTHLDLLNILGNGRIQIPAGGVIEAPVSINAQTGTAYTLVLTDAGRVIEMNNAAANTLTVPTDASVNFPIGTVIDIFQTGAGQTTVGGAGVTINARPGLKLSGQWATATLIKRAANTWLLTGSLSA